MIPSIELLTEEITEEKYPNRTYKIEDGVGVVHADSEVSGQGSVTITDHSPHEHNVNVKLESYLPTDFSPKRTGRNLIPVESGGTLTFKNQYGYAVPNKVTFDLDSSESDFSVAYVKGVPKTNFPVAKVNQIGGVTRKCTNLCDLGSASFGSCVLDGETIRSNINDFYYSALSFYTKSDWILSMRGKPITFSVKETHGKSISIVILGTRADGSTYQEETTSNRSVTMVVADDFLTVNVLELRINRLNTPYTDTTSVFEELMLNEGAALPYEPYFEGLRSAPVTEVESVGVNLFDPAPIGTKTFIGLTYTTEDGYVKINGTKINGANIHPMTEPKITLPAGTYTVSVRMISGTVSGIEGTGGVFFGINKNSYSQRTTPGVSKVGDVGVRTFTLSEPTLITSFDIAPDYGSVGAVFNNAVFACQFEQAATATDFKPYTRNTLPIPEAVQALDGYGDGVNESVYNYIDLDAKPFVKRVWKVDLGTLTWAYSSNNTIFYSAGLAGSAKGGGCVVCDKFTSVVGLAAVQSTDKSIGLAGDKTLYAHDSTYTDAAAFKAAMSGVMLYYELATPEITDISDLLPSYDVTLTARGNNLIPYPYDDTTHTVNGITFIDNGDGTITANGTATGNATYFVKNYSLSLSAGKYTISGLPFDGSWTTAITQLASSNGFAFNNFLAQGETFTLDSEVNDMVVVLVVFKGYTANNLVFKPMLNQGTTALPYEPYRKTTYVPNEDGVIENIKSISPTMILETNFNDITINAVYQKTVQVSTPVCANLTDDLDAIKQAIRLILSCERYEYLIYSWDYGVELVDLIGQPMPYVMSELPRRITEALTTDDRINDVVDFEFEPHGKKLYTTFTVVTDMGNIPTELEVDI